MAKKYKTSFEFQTEEKKTSLLKIMLILILITGAAAIGYAQMVPSEKRFGWFNTAMEESYKCYEDSVIYMSKYIPALGEWTGIVPAKPAISRAPEAKPEVEPMHDKIKVRRSNQNP